MKRYAAGFVLFLSACSSVITIEQACPYGGTRLNSAVLSAKESGNNIFLPVNNLKALAAIDLIPSLVGDTLLLPVQGVRYLVRDDNQSTICDD